MNHNAGGTQILPVWLVLVNGENNGCAQKKQTVSKLKNDLEFNNELKLQAKIGSDSKNSKNKQVQACFS